MALRGLARQGRGGRFLGLDAYPLLHPDGSSAGKTRIYRRAYFEHANYVPWIEESIRVFEEMEREHEASFLQECGTMIMEQSPNPQSSDPNKLPPKCKAAYRSAQKHGIPIEYLDAPSLKERFPQFRLDRRDMVGILEPSGGFVRCEDVMAAALKEAKEAPNVDIMDETKALSLDYVPSDDVNATIELTIQTRDEKPVVVATKSLLVCMGIWTGQLFPSWAPQLRPIRQLQGWIHSGSEEMYSYRKMPTFISLPHSYGLPLYGLPPDNDGQQLIKIGIHGRSNFAANPYASPNEVSAAERAEFLQAIRHVFDVQKLKGTSDDVTPENAFAHIQTSTYTMSPDTHFMIGTPAGHDQVFCVAGLSGYGYKQSPALGQILVDYALGNDLSKWNMGFCDPGRFGV